MPPWRAGWWPRVGWWRASISRRPQRWFGWRAAVGTEIFPKVDAGQIQLRLRRGTAIGSTEAIALQALDLIQQEVGPQNVRITLGFLGVHGSPYPINFIYLWNGGPEEGVLQVQLKPGTPVRIEPLKDRLRKVFAEKMPGSASPLNRATS